MTNGGLGTTVAVAVAAATLSATIPMSAAAQTRTPDVQRRRDQIHMMEGVLSSAVRIGAEQVSRRLQSVDPSMQSMTVLTGQARARGFVLEGYGIFFDVEVPSMVQSAVWSMITVQRGSQVSNALDSMRRIIQSLPDTSSRQQMEQAFTQVAQQLAPRGGAQTVAESQIQPTPGTVAAANLELLDDPEAQYTDAVRDALVDAMLDYSVPMDLGPDEWLTVAARETDGPLPSNQIYDSMTIVLRVKGSDLAAFAADRSRRAEFRQKVEVRLF